METKPDATADVIAASLRKLIFAGELPDGARLVERELAQRFAVSRVPMREAIQRLAGEGLVDLYKNRGATVRALTGADIDEIYGLRMLLEGDAIERAAGRMDAETLARADLVHHLLDTAGTSEKQGELNREFHALLYAPCGNGRQLGAIQSLRSQVERYERLQTTLLAGTPGFQDEHAAILEACRDADGRRARAMTIAHLESARRIIGAALAMDGSPAAVPGNGRVLPSP